MKKLFLMLLGFSMLFSACKDETETMVIDSSLPQGEFEVSRMGSFVDQNDVGTSGSAALGTDSESDEFLRFSDNFMTELGTGTVSIYLTTRNEDLNELFDPAGGNQEIELVGIVQTNGEQFFKLDTPDSDKFSHVILWCASAGIPFGNAELN
jgi:hypothetical protein